MEHVFIIGAARSGTKFLRDTLAAGDGVSVIPYDINYVWRYGNENNEDDLLLPSMCGERTRRYVRGELTRLARKACGDARVLVEKTVSNALRVPFVDTIFPEARYIFLVRDGRDVIASAYKMWQAPQDFGYLLKKLRYFPIGNYRYAAWFLGQMLRPSRRQFVWGPRYPGVDDDVANLPLLEVCAKQWSACVDVAAAAFAPIGARVLTIRYEDLVRDPGVIERICTFIGIPAEQVRARFNATVQKDAGGKWRSVWSPAEEQRVLAVAATALTRYGYLSEG